MTNEAIPFALYLIWWQEGKTFRMDNLKDWQGHCLPGEFWVYVDAYPSPTACWNVREMTYSSYELHAEKLPAGFVAGVLSLDTYEEVIGYLSALEQGRTTDLPTWIEQDWNEIPLHGFDTEKLDWAADWMNVVYPDMPENFDINWLDADYIMKEFLRFNTNEWYKDKHSRRVWYR